ncbi:MAG TPA: ADP-ribosylglycohydrolase family protein, partial [Steroidobacteraceae bacterium]|nr:ADP-ribosylglycohydrolase family protein [Steroidobacteraceae bacterium]
AVEAAAWPDGPVTAAAVRPGGPAAIRPDGPAALQPPAVWPGEPTAPSHGAAGTLLTDEADPLLDPEALSAARNLRERYLGALLGLAVGDAVAAATQYRRPGSFTPVGDMLGGGPFDLPRGGYSDDTAMALCLADSLLECNGFDARDQIERYRRWQQEGYLSATGQCVGITASTARAIAMAQWRRQAFSGSHDPLQLDPEPLSRVAPAVMFFFSSRERAIEQAAEAARTTCQARAVLDACSALARAVHAALSGQPKAAVLEKAVQAPAAKGGGAPPPGRTPGGRNGGAPAVLSAAVAAFGATDNFRDAILYAANIGGDSDVVTAVCGQLAGAYYTVKAIPVSWHNGLMHKELMASYADRLLAHALLSLGG